MDLPFNPKDRDSVKAWCVKEVLKLLNKNTGPLEDDPEVGYTSFVAGYDIIDGHPELIDALMDVPDIDVYVIDTGLSSSESSQREVLNGTARMLAIGVIRQLAEEDPEIKRINASRQAGVFTPA